MGLVGPSFSPLDFHASGLLELTPNDLVRRPQRRLLWYSDASSEIRWVWHFKKWWQYLSIFSSTIIRGEEGVYAPSAKITGVQCSWANWQSKCPWQPRYLPSRFRHSRFVALLFSPAGATASDREQSVSLWMWSPHPPFCHIPALP